MRMRECMCWKVGLKWRPALATRASVIALTYELDKGPLMEFKRGARALIKSMHMPTAWRVRQTRRHAEAAPAAQLPRALRGDYYSLRFSMSRSCFRRSLACVAGRAKRMGALRGDAVRCDKKEAERNSSEGRAHVGQEELGDVRLLRPSLGVKLGPHFRSQVACAGVKPGTAGINEANPGE